MKKYKNNLNFLPFFTLVLNLILFLILGTLLEETAWMESDIELKSLEEESTETWMEWINTNKVTILFLSIVVVLNGVM